MNDFGLAPLKTEGSCLQYDEGHIPDPNYKPIPSYWMELNIKEGTPKEDIYKMIDEWLEAEKEGP